MNDEKKDLIKIIKQNFPKLSKGQKLIAQFIMDNYDKAAFMTASRLGEKVGVSESTVVRFASALGFDGYPKLQKSLQELIKTKLTTVQRVEMSRDYSNDWAVLNKILKSDIENIRNTLDEINPKSFENVIDDIVSAKRIYIVGLRSSTAITEYLGFYLNLILDNVIVVSYGISDVFEQIIKIDEEDLVIGISFPRYSKKTYEVLEFAKKQGAKVVSLTDSQLSPIATLSDNTLIAKSNMASFVDSLVAPLSLINALIVALGMREKDKIKRYFDKLEHVWKEYHIYDDKE
ncbi:transcriptional regulator, RpiR family [Peptoclostridium litorale DSM 5388]|uniref:Transcriptional regulator, RpiR family n=1 Tax=Peptoclostridium litorale DSM 5388 TaxID=1121324 RepID=A0A069RBQ8_PEPLI|nr:MurR/RpiR family transcriptional regulator [Peptoclostridium litorale]KDR94193.1 transcriptional regulator, RpiR family [Peptoclostridium litorale DSM 5388]SIN82097.1 transcriptional regulator, RpiR family [Peptoclostridium litorale DSM 5388]